MNNQNLIILWTGGTAMVIGGLLWLILTVSAFRQSIGKGLLCWLFFPYTLYFALRHYRGSKVKIVYPYLLSWVLLLLSAVTAANQLLTNQVFGGSLSKPIPAGFSIGKNPMARLTQSETDLWYQYLAGNFRWEIRKERGLYYAVRREQQKGRYTTTLNGFYTSEDTQTNYLQTRVLLSFGDSYGFGNHWDRVTETKLTDEPLEISPVIEEPHSGSPGYGSYVIFKMPHANLEIYEQAAAIERVFTPAAFNQTKAELEQVLLHADELRKTGRVPMPDSYPEFKGDSFQFGLSPATPMFLKIREDMQPGIYLVTAWIPVQEKSEAFLKVFDQKTGAALSEVEIKQKSLRMMGWSEQGDTRFPYQAQLTVYEGDWDHAYPARFELWLRSHQTGKETKIINEIETIHGWER